MTDFAGSRAQPPLQPGPIERQPRAADGIQVAPATIRHVYQLAANLRQEEIAAAAKMGRDAKAALRMSFKSSPFYRRVALLGDDVLAMWGLSFDILSDAGFPWLITSRQAARHRLALLKIGRLQLAEMLQRRPLLIDYVDGENGRPHRLLRFFGFRRAVVSLQGAWQVWERKGG